MGNILIVGGTGTLGSALIKKLTRERFTNIKVLSRDEQKHYRLKREFPHVEFILGDIRDKSSITRHFENVDSVFHVAALKHIDLLELNPIESVKTNILGTINVCESCLEAGVRWMMFSSTDKAVDPINVYGNCKSISEKIVLNYNKDNKTTFTVFRWGNIINSNGSALPYFIDCVRNKKIIPLTHANMTRFFITIEKAVDFVYENYQLESKEVYVYPEMKAARIDTVISVIGELLNEPPLIKISGLRPGEKIDECLYSKYSGRFMDSKICPQYSREELKELIGPMI